MEGTTTRSDGAADERWSADASTAEQPVLATALGDSCASCGSRLAGDQHYCVECGERRGKARYSLAQPAAVMPQKPARSRAPRGPRWSGSGTLALIAGVGVLLMAMGVGVLIGRTSNSGQTRTQYVPLAATPGAATSAAPTTPAAAATGATAAKSSKSATTGPHGKVTLTKATKTKLKVIPKKLQSAVAKTGQKCAGGGTFQGSFFGSTGTNHTGCSK
jgi:hypothetical protein